MCSVALRLAIAARFASKVALCCLQHDAFFVRAHCCFCFLLWRRVTTGSAGAGPARRAGFGIPVCFYEADSGAEPWLARIAHRGNIHGA